MAVRRFITYRAISSLIAKVIFLAYQPPRCPHTILYKIQGKKQAVQPVFAEL